MSAYGVPPIRLQRSPTSHTIELRRESIENHKMKTRCFDHIDLRVKNLDVAGKFYAKFLPQLGFVKEIPGKKYHIFFSAGGDKPSEFFGLDQDKNHKPNRTRIAFWADTRKEVDRLAKSVRKEAAKRLKVRKSAGVTVPAIMHFSSRIRMVTSWKFAAGKDRSLRNDAVSAKR